MNWFEIINKATKYIEENITDEIRLEDIAKECNVSYFYFSKTFSIFTGYSLKEYIRNRRITLASYEVSYTKNRIIDIALKYGYSSNEAFSRAFKMIHGINPSEARKNDVTVYTHFPVLNFEVPFNHLISLTYDIVENVHYTFNGISTYIIEENYHTTETFQREFQTKFIQRYKVKDIASDKPQLYKVLYNLSKDTFKYDYLVGYDKNQKELYDDDIVTIEINAKKCIRFCSNSIELHMIPKLKLIIYNEWCKNGYEIDGLCEIEYVTKNKKDTLDFVYIVSIK
jgi:AraC family transcriptional regulator